MGFWNFLRDMFMGNRVFGNHRKGTTPTNHSNDYMSYPYDCDSYNDFTDSRSSRSTRSTWDDGHYASEDYYHDSHDDYAHDFDDFDDDY